MNYGKLVRQIYCLWLSLWRPRIFSDKSKVNAKMLKKGKNPVFGISKKWNQSKIAKEARLKGFFPRFSFSFLKKKKKLFFITRNERMLTALQLEIRRRLTKEMPKRIIIVQLKVALFVPENRDEFCYMRYEFMEGELRLLKRFRITVITVVYVFAENKISTILGYRQIGKDYLSS